MARPALVIGLGGTGQWVLTYLKKDLIEANNGRMPDTVHLLAFDTMPRVTAELAAASGQQGEKEVKVGSIQLEEGIEFIPLTGNLHDFAVAVKQGQLPHIGSWYRADTWLSRLPLGYFTAYGAGQLRQFGRLFLFQDLRSLTESEVWRRLDTAIGLLEPKLNGQRLEIIIVGSFAGGTGSGIFIDMGLLARARARTVPNIIRGYFVLPRAFDPDPSQDMLARSFAAWRELDRFMTISEEFPMPILVYNSRERALQLREIKNKVFDACYLVDGVRGGVRVATSVEMGVHPAVAEAIGAILDEKAGGTYTEWVTQNLAPEYVVRPGTPLYSTVGTYSYKVPVYYSQQEFSHQLTIHWLDAFLKPVRDDPENPDRVTRVEATSPYDPAKLGRDEAFTLLQDPQEYQGQSEVPTMFFGRIAQVVLDGGANNVDLINQHAEGSLGRRRGRGYTFLEDFTSLGDRADMSELIQRIRKEATLKVLDVVKPSKEANIPVQEWPRYFERNFPPFEREHYGYRTAGGEEYRGKFGVALDECRQAQVDIFRRLVRIWLMRTLMGGNKQGRLGYAFDLLDGLIAHFNDFLTFMEKVKEKRSEINPYLQAQEERNRKKKVMEHHARKIIFGLVDDLQAYGAQRAYLEAVQAVVDARKDALLHDAVVQTASAMRDYCMEVRDELARWIRMLATGDPATGIEGFYTLLSRQQRDIEKTGEADKKLGAIQNLVGELKYPEELEKQEIGRLMEGLTWRVEEGERFQLSLSIEPRGEQAMQLARFTGQEKPEVRQHLTQRNLEAMQGYAARRFSQLPAEVRVAELLAKEFTPQDFANEIESKAKPLHEASTASQAGPARQAELIRISTEGIDATAQAFIREVERIRRRKWGKDPDKADPKVMIQAVGSANPYKCTVVCTDDILPSERFRAWHDCMKAYLEHKEMPPELNHVFPAEANAAQYELKVANRWARGYKVFHPWVVMLLEHPERLEQFFLCWALGWITAQSDGSNSWYELAIPGLGERYRRPFRLSPAGKELWSPFQVARAFVLEGRDQTLGSTWTLDYQEVQEALEAAERQSGDEKWLAFLQKQVTGEEKKKKAGVDERLVVHWLRNHIQELKGWERQGKERPKGEPADYEQAYTDLADVAEVMFIERQERKEWQMGRRARA